MKRVYHPYWKWEEHHFGMWKKLPKQQEDELLIRAIEFTGNAKLYGSFMLRAIKEWPFSCEQNLTCQSMNRQAWVGHAACCIALGCPEHITRQAWHQLTDKQRDEANLQADRAIALWEKTYISITKKEKIEKCLKYQLVLAF